MLKDGANFRSLQFKGLEGQTQQGLLPDELQQAKDTLDRRKMSM